MPAGQRDAGHRDGGQGQHFQAGEDDGQAGTELHLHRVDAGEEDQQGAGNGVFVPGEAEQPVEVDREDGGDTRGRQGLAEEHVGPAEDEGMHFAEALVEKHVQAAGAGEHRAEFRVGERGEQREDAADEPHRQDEDRAAHLAGDIFQGCGRCRCR